MKVGGLRLPGGLLVAGICFLMCACGEACAQEGALPPILSGCEVDYPPFCMVHEDGRADGFSVELLTVALAKMGREVTYRTGPWSEVRGWLENGDIEALPLVGRTPEREELFDFTVPYLTMHGAIVVRDSTTDVHSLADLQGRVVAVMAGDNAEEFLRREPRDFEIVTELTFADAFQRLAVGACDAVVIQRLIAIRLLEETGLSAALRIVDQPILEFAQDFCFAVTEGDHELLALLNEGLALVMADGTHRRLYTKWFAHLELPSDRAIVIGGDANYPPFEFLDKDGHPQGYNVDVVRAVAQAAGLTVEIRLGLWTDMVQALESGAIDAMEGMLYSAERESTFDFSQAHIVNHCVAVVRKGDGLPPVSIEDLTDMKIVVQDGDVVQGFLLENGLESHVTAVASQEAALLELAQGDHDCALVARSTALFWIDHHEWSNLVVGRVPLLSPEYCFAVPEGSSALLAELSEGLVAIKQSGEYQRIYEKWMGIYDPNLTAQRTLKLILIVAGSLAIAIVLILIWVRSLRRQVARRTAALAALSHRHQAILEEIPDIVMEVDARRVYVWSNPAGRAFFGDDVIGREASQYFVGEQETYQAVQQLFDGSEEIVYVESRQRRFDGADRLLAWWCRVLKDEAGSVVGALSTARDITDQRQAEEELASQYRLLRVAGKTARFGGWSVDLATNTCTWSDTVADIHGMPFGFSPDVEAGLAFYAPEWRDKITELFTHCAEQGTAYDEEMEIVTQSGERVWVRTAGEAVRDEQGRIVRVEGSFQDITARKQTEWRIVHANRVLRAIRDVNQLITHETDRDALLRRSCEILISTRGYGSAWIAFQDEERKVLFVTESGIGAEFAAVRGALARGEWPPCCLVAREDSGGIDVVHNTDTNCTTCSLSRSHRETAALVGMLRFANREYGVLVVALPTQLADDAEEQSLFKELVGDIAYALHAMELESQHGEVEEALRESEEKYRTLVDNAQQGVVIAQADPVRLRFANPAMCDLTGYTEEELLAMDERRLPALIESDDRKRFFSNFRRRISGQDIPHQDEYRIARKDGTTRWVSLYSSLIDYLGEKATLTTFVDITERKRTEEERERLEIQLRQAQKMEAVGRLAGGVAHDFNNLLMGIMNYADLCRDTLDANHPSRKWLDEITREAERSANLTRQLLAFASKQTVNPQVLNLNDAVGGMLRMLHRLIGEGIELVWKPGDQLRPVSIDPGQVDQILANLCINARDAISGVGTLTIETGNASIDEGYCAEHAEAVPGDYVLLAVSDDGRGMDLETLGHAFEPFFTTKNVGEGTGLGLATVYGIVRQNGGFVNVYSEPEHGSTFRIYLPPVHEPSTPTADPPGPVRRMEGHETILLVEDEMSIRKTLCMLLERLGYTVLAAEDPDSALRLASHHPGPVDLLITDVVMPGMSGRDLAERLLPTEPDMMVLYMSGYTANVIAHQGILEEGVHFLSKPISRDDLVRAVRQLLDNR